MGATTVSLTLPREHVSLKARAGLRRGGGGRTHDGRGNTKVNGTQARTTSTHGVGTETSCKSETQPGGPTVSRSDVAVQTGNPQGICFIEDSTEIGTIVDTAAEIQDLRANLRAAEEVSKAWEHHAGLLGERLAAVEAQRWALVEQCRGWRERCLQEAAYVKELTALNSSLRVGGVCQLQEDRHVFEVMEANVYESAMGVDDICAPLQQVPQPQHFTLSPAVRGARSRGSRNNSTTGSARRSCSVGSVSALHAPRSRCGAYPEVARVDGALISMPQENTRSTELHLLRAEQRNEALEAQRLSDLRRLAELELKLELGPGAGGDSDLHANIE